MYNKYLKTSSTNPISICPSDAQISNSSALTFDLVKMEFKSHESSAPLIKLGDLDKWVEENPNKYRKLKDEDKRTAHQGLADNNGSSSDGYKWDRLTGESLFLLSERLSDISSLSFGPVEPVSSYTPVSNYIAKSKYDVRIGIRPWDISKNEKTDSCNRHKSKAIHPIFVRPRSVYDKPENSDKSKLGYKLASSLSGLPEANIRHDLGFKLFVEVEERKAVSSYDPIRCRAEKVFSYSQRYVTARNKTIVKTTSVTTTTPPVSSFQANLASNKNNNKLVSSKANNNKLVSNNLVSNLANKANSKHNPSTISLSSVSNSEADSSDSSSTSTTTTTLQCTTNSDNSTTCRFKLEGRVWDRGYRCPDGNDDNDEGYCLNSSFSKGVFLCRLNKKISGIDYPVGDWFLCDDLSGSSFTIGDDTHPVTAQLYASDPSDPEDGDRSKDKELHLRFTELPAPDSSIEYSIELRLVDEYGNYSPSPQEDALIFSTTTTTDPCAGVTCTGIQRCNSATGRCECPANHASCRNNAICCDPGSICVNNGCACDDTACGLLGKVCVNGHCVNQQTQQTCEQKRGVDNCKTCVGVSTHGNPVTKTCPSSQTLNTNTCVCEASGCTPASCPSGWGTDAPCSGGSSQQVTGGCNDTITCYRGGTVCSSPTPYCSSGSCVRCTDDWHCSGRKVCENNSCVDPPPACNKSCSNCSGACDSCDTCTGTCTKCLPNYTCNTSTRRCERDDPCDGVTITCGSGSMRGYPHGLRQTCNSDPRTECGTTCYSGSGSTCTANDCYKCRGGQCGSRVKKTSSEVSCPSTHPNTSQQTCNSRSTRVCGVKTCWNGSGPTCIPNDCYKCRGGQCGSRVAKTASEVSCPSTHPYTSKQTCKSTKKTPLVCGVKTCWNGSGPTCIPNDCYKCNPDQCGTRVAKTASEVSCPASHPHTSQQTCNSRSTRVCGVKTCWDGENCSEGYSCNSNGDCEEDDDSDSCDDADCAKLDSTCGGSCGTNGRCTGGSKCKNNTSYCSRLTKLNGEVEYTCTQCEANKSSGGCPDEHYCNALGVCVPDNRPWI